MPHLSLGAFAPLDGYLDYSLHASGSGFLSWLSDPGLCRDSRAKNTPTQSHVTVGRLTSGVEYARPLGVGWRGTFGLNWQRATCFNQHMVPITQVGKQVVH